MDYYGGGWVASALGGGFKASTLDDHLEIIWKSEQEVIPYLEIQRIEIKKGFLRSRVEIGTINGIERALSISNSKASCLHKDLKAQIQKKLIAEISKHESQIGEVAAHAVLLIESSDYLSKKDVKRIISQIPNVGYLITHPFFEFELLNCTLAHQLKACRDLLTGSDEYLSQINENKISRAIVEYEDLFKNLEKHTLSSEQLKAILINEDRNLLIAAAGSGKSATIVAKAIYLICSRQAKPEEILILAYNKDAQIELEERFKRLIGVAPQFTEIPKIKTFHGFGVEILSQVQGQAPRVSKFASSSKQGQVRIFSDLLRDLYRENSSFREAWREYLLLGGAPAPDFFKIKSRKEYEDYLIELGAVRRSMPEGMVLMIPTLDGKEVRSFEEARIANWLTLNGVNYEYERKYSIESEEEEEINYYPDFYYPEADLYHEHFAINEEGVPPTFIGLDYVDDMKWKREFHAKNKTKLIETHSAHFKDGTAFDVLRKKLEEHGVAFNPLSSEKIDQLVKEKFDPETDVDIFISFLSHFKSNSLSITQLHSKINEVDDKFRARLFLKLFEIMYAEYTNRLVSAGEIDFQDQINRACEIVESNEYRHSLKYLLVDEFQDASWDRKRLIDAILKQNEATKFFAVGDDWQSIYRFSGADIQIMTQFQDYFGPSAINHLTATYRSHQGIVDVASQFVQKNPQQLKKVVKALSDTSEKPIEIIEYESQGDHDRKLEDVLRELNRIAQVKEASVFLLGRYNHLEPSVNEYPSLHIKFSTVHASKGLEADYVVLLNVEAGKYGFPSAIGDDPLLKLVMPAAESYPFAEERRLLYVALTRAKKAVYILSNAQNVSPFVEEISKMARVIAPRMEVVRSNPCSSCSTSEMVRRIGKFGAFYGCTNYPDCDETYPALCPKCGEGKLLMRESKYGQFLSCSQYPKCNYKESLKNDNLK